MFSTLNPSFVARIAVALLMLGGSVRADLTLADILGTYCHADPSTDMHFGTLAVDKGQLKWTDYTGRSWALIPDLANQSLQTDKSYPYYPHVLTYTLLEENGRVTGFKVGDAIFEYVKYDLSKMIPLQSAKRRKNEFVARLTGAAFAGDEEYEVNFDTGSWPLCVPYGCLDKSKVKVLETNVQDPWGKLADKVQGQVAMKSVDGKHTYFVDDYIFFARKDPNGTDAPDDRQKIWGNAIMGAFPSTAPRNGLDSLTYALAKKYAKKGEVGFGIATPAGKSYMFLGTDKSIVNDKVQWRTDIPLWRENLKFCPEATPGFTVTLAFPGKPAITTTDLIATIDTGAPEMVLRLNKDNPQHDPMYADFFTSDGYWKSWDKGDYSRDAKMIVGNSTVTVTVSFTDSAGKTLAYSFQADNEKNKVAIGTWDGRVPWPISMPSKPQHRFNLGNNIYRTCPLFVYDIDGKRVGIQGPSNATPSVSSRTR